MTTSPPANKHVLIVEDEPDHAVLLQSILAGAGYSVAVAHKCEDALAEVRRTRPDVITLDIHMPRKSGAFFYRQLKSQQKYRDIPVVVVTGLTRDKEMEKLIRAFLEPGDLPHPDAYLEKPVNGPSLLKAVETAISSPRSGKR